jgi:hypothetical protein
MTLSEAFMIILNGTPNSAVVLLAILSALFALAAIYVPLSSLNTHHKGYSRKLDVQSNLLIDTLLA